MNTAIITDRIPESSPRVKARMAGVLYVLTGLTSVIGEMSVPGRLVVRGDDATTANNILAHQPLFGLAIGSLLQLAPLVVLGGGHYRSAFKLEQLQALALGEGSLMLWLLVIGVKAQPWKEQASARGLRA